ESFTLDGNNKTLKKKYQREQMLPDHQNQRESVSVSSEKLNLDDTPDTAQL
ncbi:hypothetical protein RYX36_012658, partial [Vicia faba]